MVYIALLEIYKKSMAKIWAVLSFSDLTEGHNGGIYKAANAYRIGHTRKTRFFIDGFGRLRHPRQSGENISKDDAKMMGWHSVIRESKCRFLWILPLDRRDKKRILSILRYDVSDNKNAIEDSTY
jgi:hypothetical protein